MKKCVTVTAPMDFYKQKMCVVWMRCLLVLFAVTFTACSDSKTHAGRKETPPIGVEVGFLAPDFRVETLIGGAMTLSEHRGKVVLINFWATWCEPCRVEMPSMEALYRSHLHHDFEILAISIDTLGAPPVRAYIEAFGFTFPVLLDFEYRVNDLYQVRVAPTSILIDRTGRVVKRMLGAKDWNHPETRALIDGLVKAEG